MRQPNVSHHRDLGVDECPHHGHTVSPALELDAVRPRANENRRVANGVRFADVITHPRKIRDDVGVRCGGGHGAHVMSDLVNGDVQGVGLT